ncbi:hypothetical protein [Providencia rettgeri]|uniref:hypothetical protein n=1 Tax=Providencia rettgeri TaxID=587 RepID=UPI0018C47D3D|nr:hypothetical protein [Providencia rettgeri]MBG5892729.1 hypothetical protein [Providencia rettgeri]
MENIFIDVIDKEYEFLCQLYWQVEGNGRFSYSMIKIEEKAQLKSKEIKTIVAKSCKAYSLKLKCVSCGEIECLRDRSHFSHLNGLEHVCIDCIRIENEKERQEKIEYINDLLFCKKENALIINDLSFENSVFLLSLIRYCADENLMYLDSLNNLKHEKLTPSYNFDLLIIEQLYAAGVIAISTVTNLKYLSVSGDYVYFNDEFMCWEVIIKETDNLSSIIDLLERKLSDLYYLQENKKSLIELCKKNNLFECFFYLNHEMNEYNFTSFQIGEKTTRNITCLLENLSVGQVFYIISKTVTDAFIYHQKKSTKINKGQAANSVVDAMKRMHERYLANGWSIYSKYRPRHCPQSVLCQVLFVFILQTDDGGIHKSLKQIITDDDKEIFLNH